MRILIIILLFLVGVFGVPQWDNRIVGGSAATVQQFPFMSNMQYGYWGVWWYQACGGSLLTTRTVLSAAHCYYGDSPSSWRVRLGSSYASSGGIDYDVSALVVHQGYNSITLVNDVAIIKLSTSAILSNSVGLARIPGATYHLPDNSSVTAVGWGALWSGGSTSELLQQVNIRTINQKTCADRYAQLKIKKGYDNWPNVTEGMLCAGALDVGGKDACQGDSGGPLVYLGDIIVGITSWGYGCAHPYYPGVNTRVSYHTSWIVVNSAS